MEEEARRTGGSVAQTPSQFDGPWGVPAPLPRADAPRGGPWG
jgi:hypothetical protein